MIPRKLLITGLGLGKYNINLEHLMVQENKEVLKKKNKTKGICWKDIGANPKRFPVAKFGTISVIK